MEGVAVGVEGGKTGGSAKGKVFGLSAAAAPG